MCCSSSQPPRFPVQVAMVTPAILPLPDPRGTNADWSAAFEQALAQLSDKKRAEALELLEDLTFLETQQLVSALRQPVSDVFDVFKDAADRGTMARKNGDQTWKETCAS